MASNWQHWLSPRPINRTVSANNSTILSPGDNILYEFIVEEDGRRVVRENHYIKQNAVRQGLSGPPLHIHLRQTESFQVEQGVLGIVKNGKEYTLTKDDGPLSIRPGIRHTFWAHASSQEDVVFNVWVQPQNADHGFDESFMRNFSGYLRDCEKDGIAPSLFQILLFLYDADIVLTPPFWMPITILVLLHHVLAYWIGAGLLGYRTTYQEYSTFSKLENRASKKTT